MAVLRAIAVAAQQRRLILRAQTTNNDFAQRILALPILGRRTTRLRLARLRGLKLHRPARTCRPAAEARRMPLVLTALGSDQPALL